jgi:hypothetical protein
VDQDHCTHNNSCHKQRVILRKKAEKVLDSKKTGWIFLTQDQMDDNIRQLTKKTNSQYYEL